MTGAVEHPLADELVARMDRDQEARDGVVGRTSDPAVRDRVAAVDAENTGWLRSVLDRHGWPLRSVVGEQAAGAAWLLAQHADRDPAFQRDCLALLAGAVSDGEASPAHLAYLTDRVRRAEGKPQLYGTQFWYGPDGTGELTPQPIEDLPGLDERRRTAGLGPFAEYEAHMRRRETDDEPD
ncbi:hypothetical protein OG792_07285 [Micromonospora sp. NBC_01699]|uniref:DUF6624 domain-containing protein n=1 Tax=Micromonospora sp. NBC_01699 TaxID=2975984 RepID=UPI002E337279|nr:DUF6624 domain-containing protein [Micromonospora sp. NBC_01699]